MKMPKYRVPLYGALLVEAESADQAQTYARMWTVSVRQMTHGVIVQEMHGIAGAHVCTDDDTVQDISDSYAAASEALKMRYAGLAQNLAEKCTNYFVGEQMWFEYYERELL